MPSVLKNTTAILSLLSFILGAAVCFFLLKNNPQSQSVAPANVIQTSYPYLSKRIFIEDQNDILINFTPLRSAMREYVGKQKDPLGVYFEYLPSGTSIGVNDQLEFVLASLLKPPVVMGVYRQIEQGKIKKGDVLTIKNDNIDQGFGDLWKKGEGSTLTVEGAIHFALVQSDNTATKMLISLITPQAVNDVFISYDIPTETIGEIPAITPKGYSSILRSLYLSSYLTQESSNEILDILTKTQFNDKIAAGVPGNVKVSHKIGVFNTQGNPERVFSDCGIVYVPQRPYLLCIMTKTGEEAKAQEYMQYLSKMVYGYIVAVKGRD